MRVFVGIDLPQEIKRGCQRVSDRLRQLDLQGRFVRAGSLHLTVKFLGEIDQGAVPRIGEVLQRIGRTLSPFNAGVGGLSVFPRRGRPRVIWVGVERVDGLDRLWTGLEDGLEPLGFPREERGYSPHLTLVRLKSACHVDALVQYLEKQREVARIGCLPVREMHLFQSVLRPEGAEYRRLLSVPLGNCSPAG